MKLLVLDRGQLLYHLVRRIVPDSVDVVYTPSFQEALSKVERHEVDGVVAELRHDHLPWSRFQTACCKNSQQIPVLFQSSEKSLDEEKCLKELCDCSRFISEPYHAREFKALLLDLVDEATRTAASASPEPASAVQ
jgi:DNA-binding NtrC family response regulator